MSGHLIILAAGVSSRMKRSVSEASGEAMALGDAVSRPKSLIRIGGSDRPFLDYVLSNAKSAGYDDIVLVVGEDHSLMKDYYGGKDKENDFNGLSVSYAVQRIPQGRDKPLGTADAVLCGAMSRPDWAGSQFTICNSDNIYSVGALETLRTSPHPHAVIAYDSAALGLTREQEYNNALLEKDDDGFLTGILEKPGETVFERTRREYGRVEVSMNVFRFSYDNVCPFLASAPIHPVREEMELATAITLLVNNQPRTMFCHSRQEPVPDLTSAKDIDAMRAYVEREFPRGPFG